MSQNVTYKISNSNGMSGGVWGRVYESRESAAAAIAQAFGWAESVLSPSWSDDEENKCWSAYETQEECDADDNGAMAPTITRVVDDIDPEVAAQRIVDNAGAAGGIDEVRRLAERGWPENRELENDSPELREAIQERARLVVSKNVEDE
ncbi:hypothetical protein [Caudoviricetes sp.]|nr:hypothetical protein [Caudoviricetes sp.]